MPEPQLPLRCITVCDLALPGNVGNPCETLRVEQMGAQEPGGLQRHAHALADDRMRFTRGIADAQQAVVGAQANAGIDRPGGEPGTVSEGRLKGRAHSAAFAPEHRFDPITSTRSGQAAPNRFEAIGADATGNGGDATVRDDHTAITTPERQHGQQAFPQRRIAEVGLEGEQIRWAARQATTRTSGRQHFPRAVCGNGNRRAQRQSRLRIERTNPQAPVSDAALDRLN